MLASSAAISPQAADQTYFVPARVAAAQAAAAPQRPEVLLKAMAVSPDDSIQMALFDAEFAAGHMQRALAAVTPLLNPSYGSYEYRRPTDMQYASADDANSDAGFTSEEDAEDGTADNRAAAMPSSLRSRADKAAFALKMATLHEQLDQLPDAVAYLKTAAHSSEGSAEKSAIEKRAAAHQARIDLDQANAQRRPFLHKTMEQANMVRPKLLKLPGPNEGANP